MSDPAILWLGTIQDADVGFLEIVAVMRSMRASSSVSEELETRTHRVHKSAVLSDYSANTSNSSPGTGRSCDHLAMEAKKSSIAASPFISTIGCRSRSGMSRLRLIEPSVRLFVRSFRVNPLRGFVRKSKESTLV